MSITGVVDPTLNKSYEITLLSVGILLKCEVLSCTFQNSNLGYGVPGLM